jgi:hypothetical protein
MNYIKKLIYKLIKTTWSVGIVENSIDELMEGKKMKFHLIKHNYDDRWFADPFVFDVTDNTIILFVEEYYNPIRRGRLSKMVVDRQSYELISLKTILELDTHLSFPFYFKKDGKVYICPENSNANEWAMYEYDDEKEECKKVKVLLNIGLADAIIMNEWGKQTMLATIYPKDNSNEVKVFDYSDEKYNLTQTFMFNERIGRNAGGIFEYKGEIYRPAQECELCYGHAISIQKIEQNGTELTFKEVRRLPSANPYRILGMHTLNSYKGVVVSDATVYKYPLFGSLLYWIKNTLKG